MKNKNAMVIMDKKAPTFLRIIGLIGTSISMAYILKKYVIDKFNDDECFGLKNTDDSIFD